MKSVSINKENLRLKCLRQVDNTDIFFLTGDSHAVHFANMMDDSSVIKNLYFFRFPTNVSVLVDQKFWTQTPESENYGAERLAKVNELSTKFKKIYYINSWFLSVDQGKADLIEMNLMHYIQRINNNIVIILIAPTPVFNTGPADCMISNRNCTLDKQRDLQRRATIFALYQKLEKRYENVSVYDPYDAACPHEECLIYDQSRQFMLYNDTHHFSVEGSKSLAPHFDHWLQQTFDLRQKMLPEYVMKK